MKQVKETLTAQCELTLPNTTHPFFIMVDASATGIGTVLVQSDEHNQMQVISYNSRLFTENEQKSAILYRELCAVAYALEIYEFIIIGSKHPITVFTDHKPILSLFARQGPINQKIFRYQLKFTKFSNLVIFWSRGKKLALADLLSRNFSSKLIKFQQARHKYKPPSIQFLATDCSGLTCPPSKSIMLFKKFQELPLRNETYTLSFAMMAMVSFY